MKFGTFASLILVFLLSRAVSAADYHQITAGGGAQTVNEWGVCKDITNNNSADLFVPTKTSAEWASFVTYPPSNVTLADCDTEPDTFSFTDVTGAKTDRRYIAGVTPTGYTGSVTVSVSSGTAQLRVNGGAWASSVTMNPGDLLEISQMTGSSYDGSTLSSTVSAGSLSIDWSVTMDTNPPSGGFYFVLSHDTTNGNFGGLSGADSFCLNDMRNNEWNGRENVSLAAINVKAFLCDGSGCQSPYGNQNYTFAASGVTSAGGASFTSDSTGNGPNDANNWSGPLYFSSAAAYWTGRSSGTATNFGLSRDSNTCSSWSTNVTYSYGSAGTANSTNGGRWRYTTTACSSAEHLICLVADNGPNAPLPFSFTDITRAPNGTQYETSTVLDGFTGTLTATASGGGAEVRVNGTGAWASSAAVSPGDTLNVRMSSDATGEGVTTTTTIAVSTVSADWNITTADPTPDSFDFTDVTGAQPGIFYEGSAVVQSFDGPMTATVDGGGALIRKNGGGTWSTSVALNPGDTLNVQMRASYSYGGSTTTTVTFGSISADWKITTTSTVLAGGHYFVRASTPTTGNLGGLLGANADCLNDLSSHTWRNSDQIALTTDSVKAFLCDSTTCQNTQPSTTYTFAVSGNATQGGDTFTTDASGLGPNDNANWAVSTALGLNYQYIWTARTSTSATAWANATVGTNCTDWTAATGSGRVGYVGSAYTNARRWNYTNDTCGDSNYLVCIVDDDGSTTFQPTLTVDWADFAGISSAETLTGFNVTLRLKLSAVVNSGDMTYIAYSLNGGTWTTFGPDAPALVDVNPGDTLQFQVKGPAPSNSATITVQNMYDGGATVDTVTGTYAGGRLFVLSKGGYTGALGGLTGAGQTCLEDLLANSWKEKSYITLNTDTVKAFLCDSTTCLTLQSNNDYFFAASGNATKGGDFFTTNASGLGPGNADTWSSTGTFGVSTSIWTGRGNTSTTLWSNTKSAVCGDWTNGDYPAQGSYGYTNNTDAYRWHDYNTYCDSNYRLICVVDDDGAHPDDISVDSVDWPDFTETSATETLNGFNSKVDIKLSVTDDSGNITDTSYSLNGGAWTSFSPASPATISIYSGSTLQFQVSGTAPTNTATITVTNVTDSNTILDTAVGTVQGGHMFILGKTAHDGNLGGLNGANDRCYDDLLANGWKNKTGLTLNLGTVKAFLCDGTNCNNLEANTKYYFAKSGSTSTGGATFVTNASGQGPGNNDDWGDATHFGSSSAQYWTNRGSASSLLWSNTSSGGSCSAWTKNEYPYAAFEGWADGDAYRWHDYSQYCDSSLPLICYVNDDGATPDDVSIDSTDWTDFTDSSDVKTLIGFNVPVDLQLSVTDDTGNIVETAYSLNGGDFVDFTPGSPATVKVYPQDTLQFKVLGSAGTNTATITATNTSDGNTVLDTVVATSNGGHFFVLTNGTYNGNLGGIAGADAKCLTDLTAQTWKYKTGLTLDASTVHAFLCDGVSCNNLATSTRYFFARSGSASVGGGTFTTDANGAGPGNTDNWAVSTQFGTSYYVWTGRGNTSSQLWDTGTGTSSNCTAWSASAYPQKGTYGWTSETTSYRWNESWEYCDSTNHLICIVDSP